MPQQIAFADRIATLLASTPAPPVAGEPTIAPAPVQTAVQDALRRGETHYTDRPGILRLRDRIAAALNGRFGIAADAKDDLVVTCGVIEARFVALQQLLAPGQAVFAPSHANRIAGSVLLRRASLVTDPAAARVLYLTGGAAEETLRQHFRSLAPEATIVFEAEPGSRSFHPAAFPGLAERTVTVGQIGHPAWQIGYLHTPRALSAGMRDFKQALTICSTNLSQWAALAAMETV